MPVKVEFSERQPNYRYMPLGNGMADVFILKFVEEIVNEEDNSTSFIYEQNEFRIGTEEITEDMIKENPLNYLNYSELDEDVALEERISAIEDALLEIGGMI